MNYLTQRHIVRPLVILSVLLLGVVATLKVGRTSHAKQGSPARPAPAAPQRIHYPKNSRVVFSQNQWKASAGRDHAFIIYHGDQDAVCREATQVEREAVTNRSGGSLHVIYPGAPRREELEPGAANWKLDSAPDLNLQPSAGFRIVLHGTSQLEQNQTAKNAFIAAANRWEAIIATPITVVIDVDFGTNFFGQPFGDPTSSARLAYPALPARMPIFDND